MSSSISHDIYEWPCGFAFQVRRSAEEAIGLFDDNLKLHQVLVFNPVAVKTGLKHNYLNSKVKGQRSKIKSKRKK